MKTIILAVVLAACLCAPAAADEASRTRLIVGGDPTSAATVRGTALRWLTARGMAVDEVASKRDTSAIAECMVQTSAAQCKGTIASDLALWFLSVEADIADLSTNVVIVARLFDATGALIASERHGCERCNEDSLRRATDDVLAALQRSSEALGASTATTDNEDVRGVGARPPSASPDPSGRGHHPRWVWGVTVGGGVALTTGIVLIALHKEPGDAPLQRVDTDLRTPGLVIGGIGAVALGVGVWQLLSPPSARAVAPARQTAIAPYLDWTTRQATAGIAGVFR